MIEIVFSDSACGSLRMAQHCGEGPYQGGYISVIVSHTDGSKPTEEEIQTAQRKAEEDARRAWERAVPLGGSPVDIFGFSLALSIGDIGKNRSGRKRRQVLEQLFSIYPNDKGHQAAQEMLRGANENLKAVQKRAAEGEPLRIWYSDQPDDMCGLYWFMEQMSHWKMHSTEVLVVKLPDWDEDEHKVILRKSGWGEVAPEEWHRYLPLQRPAPSAFQQSCISRWRELQREDTPLRAVLNGQLTGVPETLYDSFILREIAAEDNEFQEARVIGRVLGNYQLGIGDAWVALRIEEMIRSGKLEVVSPVTENMPIYHRRLKKCHNRQNDE